MCMPERKWKNWIFQTPSLEQVEDVVTRAHQCYFRQSHPRFILVADYTVSHEEVYYGVVKNLFSQAGRRLMFKKTKKRKVRLK